MRFETPDQIIDWIENNLNYFWSQKDGYSILDLSKLPFETPNLCENFIFFESLDDVIKKCTTLNAYIFIDIEFKFEVSIHFINSMQKYKIENQSLVEIGYYAFSNQSYSEQDVLNSFRELNELLNK